MSRKSGNAQSQNAAVAASATSATSQPKIEMPANIAAWLDACERASADPRIIKAKSADVAMLAYNTKSADNKREQHSVSSGLSCEECAAMLYALKNDGQITSKQWSTIRWSLLATKAVKPSTVGANELPTALREDYTPGSIRDHRDATASNSDKAPSAVKQAEREYSKAKQALEQAEQAAAKLPELRKLAAAAEQALTAAKQAAAEQAEQAKQQSAAKQAEQAERDAKQQAKLEQQLAKLAEQQAKIAERLAKARAINTTTTTNAASIPVADAAGQPTVDNVMLK